jgi:hypothetical protein
MFLTQQTELQTPVSSVSLTAGYAGYGMFPGLWYCAVRF